MQLLKSSVEKHKAHHEQLLRDFPWLWAVQNSWSLGYDEIFVKSANDEALEELRVILIRKPHKLASLWLLLEYGNTTRILEAAVFEPEKSLGENVYANLQPDGHCVKNILLVEHLLSLGKKRFTIYRALKKDPRALHHLVCVCKC